MLGSGSHSSGVSKGRHVSLQRIFVQKKPLLQQNIHLHTGSTISEGIQDTHTNIYITA